jgi:hypothetical protein
VKVVIEDFLDKSSPVERTYENLTFEDDKETIISFQVPNKMAKIKVDMDCQVQNMTTNSLQKFSARTFEQRVQYYRDS